MLHFVAVFPPLAYDRIKLVIDKRCGDQRQPSRSAYLGNVPIGLFLVWTMFSKLVISSTQWNTLHQLDSALPFLIAWWLTGD